MPIATPLDQFRLLIGDTDSTRQLFNDVEAQWFIDQRPGNVLLAAADACDSLATRFARDYDFSTDGQSFRRSSVAIRYETRARELRARAPGSGLSTVSVTRVDGYSDDIAARDGAGQATRTGRVRAGYSDPDLPV